MNLERNSGGVVHQLGETKYPQAEARPDGFSPRPRAEGSPEGPGGSV